MYQQQQLQSINLHQLSEKCRSKKELYRFLQQDSKAFLPKVGSIDFKRRKRSNIQIHSLQTIASQMNRQGLTVQDLLNYARLNPNLLKYLPEERDWVHLDRQWICDVLYSIDTDNIQSMVDEAIQKRNQKIEHSQNLTIQIKPEFAAALESCIQFSSDKGRSIFLLKDSSKRKRTRQELDEVKNEEEILKQDKQEFLRNHKRIKRENELMEQQLSQVANSQQIINTLIEAGILNQNGELILQQQFNI